ncbi:histidine kinase [Streptomyces sp. NRRL F-5135]|uniref:histidine kinase n=1 Tax=Streptomyces sp. NRRL F-5135 TaxID=1463858 RepID=UPI0004CBEF2E|nr:histidine kinase [Streptomyces sp. NRRL F-5135]
MASPRPADAPTVDDARRAQALEAAQATQRERARIAGGMHDVVAHSLTLLVVHAPATTTTGSCRVPRPVPDPLTRSGTAQC